MLVISRKSQEYLPIGEDIVVKVIKTARGSVKIGIEAPGGTRVLRGELFSHDASDDSDPSPPRRRMTFGGLSSRESSPVVEAV